MPTTRHTEAIEVDRIFLYEENPRHEPIESEPEIIEYLCKDEQVFNLARSISEAGTNPLQLLGVLQIPGSGAAATKKVYQVWDGNRRVCAITRIQRTGNATKHHEVAGSFDGAQLANDLATITPLLTKVSGMIALKK